MTQTFAKGNSPAVHRIDLTCERTGFSKPPFDVHIKFLPSPTDGAGWTVLAHAAAGKPDALARWLDTHSGIEAVRVAPGLAPKLFRGTAQQLPQEWATVATFAKVHHLDLAADGHASWFVEGPREQILQLVQHLSTQPNPGADEVRCRPVVASREATITRRQLETLATAVSLGYYEIPHRLDLRALATHTGLSLGSVSELLRRAEGAILTHYIDANLMTWPRTMDPAMQPWPPVPGDLEGDPVQPVTNLLRR